MTTEQNAAQFRLYEQLWQAIASGRRDAVSAKTHPNNVRRLIQAVRKEKALANSLRKMCGQPAFGRMTCKVEQVSRTEARVTFSLAYNGDML